MAKLLLFLLSITSIWGMAMESDFEKLLREMKQGGESESVERDILLLIVKSNDPAFEVKAYNALISFFARREFQDLTKARKYADCVASSTNSVHIRISGYEELLTCLLTSMEGGDAVTRGDLAPTAVGALVSDLDLLMPVFPENAKHQLLPAIPRMRIDALPDDAQKKALMRERDRKIFERERVENANATLDSFERLLQLSKRLIHMDASALKALTDAIERNPKLRANTVGKKFVADLSKKGS
jgi:hypothetical protein